MSVPAPLANPARARLAFVGLGWIGRKRLESLAADPLIEIAACVDVDESAARRAARECGPAAAFTDLAPALALDIDGVIIASPSGLHESQSLAALDRGHAVFCEKPLATRAAGVERVLVRAATVDRLLGVDFCYRHVAGMDILRSRLRAHAYGEILAIDLTFHNAYAPAASWSRDRALAGGGCLLDLGVHLLDLLCWLQDFPEIRVESASLFANGRPMAPGAAAIEDRAIAQLRQRNGACVRLACSWNMHLGQGAVIELAIHGAAGGAVWRNVNGSFYDFECFENFGDRRNDIVSGPDDWGPRALRSWARQLTRSNRFESGALGYAASARLVDAIYAQGEHS